MKTSAWHRLDTWTRCSMPLVLTLLVVVLGMVPLQIPNVAPVIPAWALIAVYFWSVHRPELMPLWAVFLIGLFQDLLSGGQLGVGILALIMVHQIIASQRRSFSRATFGGLWLIFALVAAGAIYVMWLLNSVLYTTLLPIRPVLFQYLTTLAVYPFLAWLFTQVQRGFLKT